MKKDKIIFSIAILLFLHVAHVQLLSKESKQIVLPKPQLDGGKPLMAALKERKSSRSFSDKNLSPQTLSNLLWAAFGINRLKSGKRTAPSAMNYKEITLYVAMKEGLYIYEPKKHLLSLVAARDLRGKTGTQLFVKKAPINLIYVADFSKMLFMSSIDKVLYSSANTGFISQNVYLFCASEGLNTVVRGLVGRKSLARAIGLKSKYKIVLCQTVGYPINK